MGHTPLLSVSDYVKHNSKTTNWLQSQKAVGCSRPVVLYAYWLLRRALTGVHGSLGVQAVCAPLVGLSAKRDSDRLLGEPPCTDRPAREGRAHQLSRGLEEPGPGRVPAGKGRLPQGPPELSRS